MPLIKDKRYLGFKSVEGFEPIEQEEFRTILGQVKHRYNDAARSLFILLYYTGRRPIEILSLTRESFRKEKGNLWVVFPTMKHGEITSLMLQLSNPDIKELARFALRGWAPGYPIFSRFIGKGKRHVKSKNKKTGAVREFDYIEKTQKVNYFIKKLTGTVPYFFRHNRFSRAGMKGASLKEIMELKGAKREASCYPYLHFSKAHKKKLVRYVND